MTSNNPANDVVFDAAGNFVSNGDLIVSIVAKPKPMIITGPAIIKNGKILIAEGTILDISSIGKDKVYFRIKSFSDDSLLVAVLGLLTQLNLELCKPKPDLFAFVDKIDDLLKRPDFPDMAEEEEEDTDAEE